MSKSTAIKPNENFYNEKLDTPLMEVAKKLPLDCELEDYGEGYPKINMGGKTIVDNKTIILDNE